MVPTFGITKVESGLVNELLEFCFAHDTSCLWTARTLGVSNVSAAVCRSSLHDHCSKTHVQTTLNLRIGQKVGYETHHEALHNQAVQVCKLLHILQQACSVWISEYETALLHRT